MTVVAAGSKAPNRTVEALLDSAYALSRRDYFMEKSWFVSEALPRQAYANIFGAIDAAGAAVSIETIAQRVSHPSSQWQGRVAGATGVHAAQECSPSGGCCAWLHECLLRRRAAGSVRFGGLRHLASSTAAPLTRQVRHLKRCRPGGCPPSGLNCSRQCTGLAATTRPSPGATRCSA